MLLDGWCCRTGCRCGPISPSAPAGPVRCARPSTPPSPVSVSATRAGGCPRRWLRAAHDDTDAAVERLGVAARLAAAQGSVVLLRRCLADLATRSAPAPDAGLPEAG